MHSDTLPLSILHVLHPARYGGLETVVLNLAAGLSQSGQDVCLAPVFTEQDAVDHPFPGAADDRGIELAPIVIAHRDYRGERRRIRQIARARGVHVVHSHGSHSDVVTASLGRSLGAASVSTVHGFTGGRWRNRVYEWLQERALRRFDGVFAVSDPIRQRLINGGVRRDRVHTVRNAWEVPSSAMGRIEARERLGLRAEGPVVGWVGRMSAEKGPDVMVRAADHVATEGVHFVMIGDGVMREECRVLARQLDLETRISWPGVVPDAGDLLNALDVLVMTSWTEGTPMVLLEAIGQEVPVVTTSVGGIPDIVSPAEAWLCEAGAPEEIGRSIDEALQESGDAGLRARRAKQRLVRERDVMAWVERHVDVYRALSEPSGYGVPPEGGER